MNQISDVTLSGVLFRAGLSRVKDICGTRAGGQADKMADLHRELAALGWGITRVAAPSKP